MAGLIFKNVSKTFHDSKEEIVKNINLEIGDDEFLVILGPSGCGKSTLLRMISGLRRPTEGRIYIGDKDVTELEPQDRQVGMVFQNYALFPHMNVKKNLEFPMKIAGITKEKRNQIINEVGNTLDIRKHLRKKPEILSGGERQRVAIGRAMVKESRVYLFDEPLSNLDEGLRAKLRPEILKLFKELKVPFVYVTHDQIDAMTMATKVAVMWQGEIQQLASPQEIYHKPVNTFVAGFVGVPRMNFLSVTVTKCEEGFRLKNHAFSIVLSRQNERLEAYQNQQIIMGIRPEDIHIAKLDDEWEETEGTLDRFEHLGNKVHLFVDVQGVKWCVAASVAVRAKIGEKLTVYLDRSKVHLFDAETKLRL